MTLTVKTTSATSTRLAERMPFRYNIIRRKPRAANAQKKVANRVSAGDTPIGTTNDRSPKKAPTERNISTKTFIGELFI
jgi:hypothetical protein